MKTKAAKKKPVKRAPKVVAHPYKVGDIVRTTQDQDDWIGTGRVLYITDDGYPSRVMKLDDSGRDDETWRLDDSVGRSVVLLQRDGVRVSGAKVVKAVAPELGMKFALKYDLDRDPVELFATKKEVRDRIAYLVANDRSLKKDSIWVYQVSKPKHVKVSTAISAF